MPTTKTFNEKLLESQKKIGAVSKSKDNPYFKSKYADINIYLEEVKPVLNEQGLILLQPTVIVDGKNALETIVRDATTGEEIKSTLFIPDGADIQKFGGGLTYLRRYELQSLLGLEAEDDDGNIASGKKTSATIKNGTNSPIPTGGVNAQEGDPFDL